MKIICIRTKRCVGFSVILAILIFIVALQNISCNDDPTKPCWMGVDSLYATGLSITDTSEVRLAFVFYQTYVDSSSTEFPDGASAWEFDHANYLHSFRDIKYWEIWHYTTLPSNPDPILRNTLSIDENGTLVFGLGCM